MTPKGQMKLFKAAAKELGEPLAFDPTKTVAERDGQLYERVRKLVMRRIPDVTDSDFDEKAGRFYGWSTNGLLEYLRGQRVE